jgi:hypothetical protein
MIIIAVVVCLLGVFLLFCAYLEDRVDSVLGKQRDANTRIIGLEVKDFSQDVRLDQHQLFLKHLRKDVHDLGSDVGWADDLTKTQALPETPDDDDTP